MGRCNSSQVRRAGMSQKKIRLLEKKKKNSNPKKDRKDWTHNVFKKLHNLKNKE